MRGLLCSADRLLDLVDAGEEPLEDRRVRGREAGVLPGVLLQVEPARGQRTGLQGSCRRQREGFSILRCSSVDRPAAEKRGGYPAFEFSVCITSVSHRKFAKDRILCSKDCRGSDALPAGGTGTRSRVRGRKSPSSCSGPRRKRGRA